jgi:hypothetical protein
MIYLTAIGLTPGGSGTVHIYIQYTEYRDGTYITLKNYVCSLLGCDFDNVGKLGALFRRKKKAANSSETFVPFDPRKTVILLL